MRVALWADNLPVLGGAEKHALLFLRPLVGRHDITVYYQGVREVCKEVIEERISFGLPGVKLVRYGHPGTVTRLSRNCDLLINACTARLMKSLAPCSLLLVFFPYLLDDYGVNAWKHAVLYRLQRRQEALREWLGTTVPNLGHRPFREFIKGADWRSGVKALPFYLVRKVAWLGGLDYQLGRHVLPTYHLLLANSGYTAEWTRRWYGRASTICYPPIDVARNRPGKKGRSIVSVGRFDGEPNSKKHHVLVQVFKELYDEGVLRGWRFLICGGTDGRPAEARYLASLRRASSGYPIELCVNLPPVKLERVYADASLYWHARGFGEDPIQHPWRYEHFGMSTAEAMAAGCVPMVINHGGQAEIVGHGQNGYCWSSIKEFKDQVRAFLRLGRNEAAVLRSRARERAADFSHNRFYTRACEIYSSLGVECEALYQSLSSAPAEFTPNDCRQRVS